MEGVRASAVDEVIATKYIWAAKPFLVAYVIAIGFTIGLLVNRTPTPDPSIAVLAGPEADHLAPMPREVEVREEPIWIQVFRPSPPTARLMLRTGLPVLALLDQDSQENHRLGFYWTATGQRPQTLFQTVLPFLRPIAPDGNQPAAASPNAAAGDSRADGSGGTQATPRVNPPGTGSSASTPRPLPPAPVPAAVVQEGQPLIGIYHTHDWESYVSEFPGMKVQKEDDLNSIKSDDHTKRTVVDLGALLADGLRELGVTSVHAAWTHQERGYSYSYQASRATAKRILKEAPMVRILLDLHRDSAWGIETTAQVNGQSVARIRCIIGKADQPHWEQNKGFCDQLTARLEQKYPGLVLPTRVQDYTYNQDLLPGAVLLEIGGAMNQYVEAERTVQLLAETLVEMVRAGQYPH